MSIRQEIQFINKPLKCQVIFAHHTERISLYATAAPAEGERWGNGHSHTKHHLNFHLRAGHHACWWNQSTLHKHKMKKSSKLNLRLQCLGFLGKKSLNPNISLRNDGSILSWFQKATKFSMVLKRVQRNNYRAYRNKEEMSNKPTHITECLPDYTFHFRDQGQVLKQAEETCSRNIPSVVHCYKANISH